MSMNAKHLPRTYSLRQIKTSSKLMATFIAMGMIVLVVGVICLCANEGLRAHITALSSQNIPKITRLSQVRQALRATRGDLSQAVLEPDYQVALRDLALVNDDELYLLGAVTHYQALSHTPAEVERLTTFHQELYPWLDTLHTIEPLAAENPTANRAKIVHMLDTQWLPQADKVDATLGQLITLS